MLVALGNRLTRSGHGCPRTRPSITRTLLLSLWTSSGSRKLGASTDGCASVLPASLVRFSPFCSGSWSLRLSFVTHLRYNEPDRLFPFPHRLLHAASASGGWAMTFEEILDQAIAMLQHRGRVSYRALKRQFDLDDAYVEDVKLELIEVHQVAVDQDNTMLVWTGDAEASPSPAAANSIDRGRPPDTAPLTYTPPYLAEKILTTRRALEGERKQVTVLFADLKGSMELLADRDPEEARKLLDPVLERMMESVHYYEGTVNQVMGDGIMALFGAPVAHEDHAVRACYAALRMQELVKAYADQAFRTHGIAVRIRVGLNSGEVVVRSIRSDLRMDYSAVGQATHLAARMEQLATPGAIWITDRTFGLVESFVQVKPLGAVPVHGLEMPVEVFELAGTSRARTRFQASTVRGLSRFVGRDAEMEQLHTALDGAKRGHGEVVAVVGEPGVGKSRLFHEVIQSQSAAGCRILHASAASYGRASSYLPVVDLLKVLFRIDERDDVRSVRAKATGHVLTLDEALRDLLSPILWLLDALPDEDRLRELEPAQRRELTLDAIKRLLCRESHVQPLVLVVEDLHWIDPETQALLDSLVESLPAAPVLLLVNYRPEYGHGWIGKTYYRQLRVDPLPPESAEELLRTLVGEGAELVPLKRLLIDRTEGNPFFLEESVRNLVETGALA